MWCCYTDWKNGMLILPVFHKHRKLLPLAIIKMVPGPSEAGCVKWGQEIMQTLVEYLLYLTSCYRCHKTNQSAALWLCSLHLNNNYTEKHTKIKGYLIYISSSGIERSAAKREANLPTPRLLHWWRTLPKPLVTSAAADLSARHCWRPVKFVRVRQAHGNLELS